MEMNAFEKMQMQAQMRPTAGFDAPDLAPVLACERTPTGWRGLTEDGEILNVHTTNGIPFDGSIAIARNGETIGYRHVPKQPSEGVIELYQQYFDRASLLLRANEPDRALVEIETAIGIVKTYRARFNRALILLSLGRWHEGFDEFAFCESAADAFMRPRYRAAIEYGMHPWQGQEIAGKRLLLIHDHGFGDSIMMLRYVPRLKAMGANVVLALPDELHRLAQQVAPVSGDLVDADYFCSLLMILHILKQGPGDIPTAPYLKVNSTLVHKWRIRIDERNKNIGIAWSTSKPHDGDYPRTVPLGEFTRALGREATLISVQQQGGAEADMLGIDRYQFEDFADCAALMSVLDEIVTIDTAALHLAGAIGHPRITLLLSHWASWRWLSPLYENVQFCRQDTPGDWESAFAKRERVLAVSKQQEDENDGSKDNAGRSD